MKNNFANKIQELQGFSLQPSEQIWQEIEHNLDDKRKKRIVGWWWSVPAIILIFGAAFWMMSEKKTTQAKVNSKTSVNNITANINDEKLQQKNNELQYSKTQILQNVTATKNISLDELQSNNNTHQIMKQKLKKERVVKQKNVEKWETFSITKHTVMQAFEPTTDKNLTDQSVFKNDVITNENKVKDVAIITIDASMQKVNEVVAIIKNETEKIDIKKINVAKTKTSKKLNWSLALGGGTNYVSRNNIVGQNETLAMSNFNGTSSVGSAVDPIVNANSLSLPKTGYHFSLGVNVDYKLSKRWTLQSGIKYQYLENKIGLQEDSVAIFPPYYYLSSKDVYTNYSNQIEVPINISYCINPNKKNEVSFQVGANISWIFKDNWLNKIDNVYRYQSFINQNKRFLLGFQTGASINFNNKFSLSLIARKYLTPAQKSTSKYYWQQIDFQLNIPFKSFKK